MLRKYLLLPLLASYGAAVTISVAKSGGNATSGLQYGAMEEVCLALLHVRALSQFSCRKSITVVKEVSMQS
jgi:hypothetical protein